MAMRIRLAVPDGLNSDETKAILDAALEAVTRGATPLVARGRVPTARDAINRHLVRWRPEPPGDEHFDLPTTVLGRGWGDCDDLAPWHAASLRASGEDPEATAFVRPSGPGRWHALVQRSSGQLEDPSRGAGMGSVGADDYAGPFWRQMFGNRLSLATYPMQRGWAGRVDIPSVTTPFGSYSLLGRRGTPGGAIVSALQGCHVVGHDIYEEDSLRLAGLHDMLCGVPPEEVAAALEQEGVGFFGALAPAALSLAAPVLSKVLPGLSPGGGGGGGAPQGGGGGGGFPSGTALHCPGGPIIVRF